MKFLLLFLTLFVWLFSPLRIHGQSASKTYYIDCNNGIDTNNGLSTTAAWKTVGKANSAGLVAGDSLLFKRGCTWTNSNHNNYLNARWNGNSSSRITIGAYGTGNAPLLQADARSTSSNEVLIDATGSYLTIENLSLNLINPVRDSTCRLDDSTPDTNLDNPKVRLGWYVGVTVSGNNNLVQNIEVQHTAIGVNLAGGTSNNKVFNLYGHNLDAFWRLSKTANALGAMGVNIWGTNQEIAYSYFENNGQICHFIDSSGNWTGELEQNYSAPFETFNANQVYVHHNRAYGHRKHLEMGKEPGTVSADNVIAYNLFVSDVLNAKGPNIHPASNQFGPIERTMVYNNTIIFTGAGSEGIVGSAGGTFKNNIFIAEWKAAYYGSGTIQSNNLYWDLRKTSDSLPDPCVQIYGSGTQCSTSTLNVDPKMVNNVVPGGNYRLTSTSPGIDRGSLISTTNLLLTNILSTDFDRGFVPQGAGVDIGAYEYTTGSISPTPTRIPTAQPTTVIAPTSAPTLAPTSAPVQGDADGNGVVDEADYNIWIANYGATTTAGAREGDFNSDSQVTGIDFVIWRNAYLTLSDTLIATFPPFSDTYVASDQPSTNFGTNVILASDNSPISISYLKYNLGYIPTTSVIQWAKLRIYVTNASNESQSYYAITPGSWNESTTTYANRPVLPATSFTTFNTTNQLGIVEIDVTSYVKNFPGNTVSFAITQTGLDGLHFSSRESANIPKLIVSYK